jgi:hydroxypyruvate isomerase
VHTMPKPSPMRFPANLSFLFKDAAFGERFRRAADAGFGGVEFIWPGLDQVDAVATAVEENGPYLLGTGEANFGFVLGLLDRSGYEGWVGCEYNPSTATTEESLHWIKELGYA